MGREGILFFSYFSGEMAEQTTEQTVAAATIIIRESVEPILEEYRPSGISSLKFSKLSLGNVASKIEGILNNTSITL
ncbi:putative calcium-dependent lipid-binding transcriptional regulator, plant [Helianthus anomalus]